jgi:hypothetical protein
VVSTLRQLAPLTEKQFQAQVVEMAKWLGWDVFYDTQPKGSVKGWPDLTLMRPPRLVFAELKSAVGRFTKPQRYWLDHLRQCGGVEVYEWRPADWPQIEEVLKR